MLHSDRIAEQESPLLWLRSRPHVQGEGNIWNAVCSGRPLRSPWILQQSDAHPLLEKLLSGRIFVCILSTGAHVAEAQTSRLRLKLTSNRPAHMDQLYVAEAQISRLRLKPEAPTAQGSGIDVAEAQTSRLSLKYLAERLSPVEG